MYKRQTHGGGEAAPPIAGDPSTFPKDAELARTLVAATTRATLSTITEDGFPSVVLFLMRPATTDCL